MYRQLEKNLLSSNISSTCPQNMVNFGPLAAEIGLVVWGTHANFNGFRILAELLHGTLVVVVSQTLRRWTEGATYIGQGGHHVGHWPTFLVYRYFDNVLFQLQQCFDHFWWPYGQDDQWVGLRTSNLCSLATILYNAAFLRYGMGLSDNSIV